MGTNTACCIETPFFFKGSERRDLFGVLHYAHFNNGSSGIVYVHPFAEEKNMSHSVAIKAARAFAAAGFPVLRFDLSCCGESQGEFQEASLGAWQEDIYHAIDILCSKAGVSTCFLWGLRLGASYALLTAKRKPESVVGLILWQPVLDFSLYFKQFLRKSIGSNIVNGKRKQSLQPIDPGKSCNRGVSYHISGYPVSPELVKSFAEIGDCPRRVLPTVPTLLVSISQMDKPSEAISDYFLTLAESGSPAMQQHITEIPFWDRYWQWESKSLLESSIQWLHSVTL